MDDGDPRRRWLRFSLRGLLIAVTLFRLQAANRNGGTFAPGRASGPTDDEAHRRPDNLDNEACCATRPMPCMPEARISCSVPAHDGLLLADASGSEVSLESLLQDVFIQSQLGHHLLQPLVLFLQILQRFGFTGREHDAETNLRYHRSRYFDSHLWINEDIIGFLGKDTNLNRYVRNSPSIWRDPFGQQVEGGQSNPGNSPPGSNPSKPGGPGGPGNKDDEDPNRPPKDQPPSLTQCKPWGDWVVVKFTLDGQWDGFDFSDAPLSLNDPLVGTGRGMKGVAVLMKERSVERSTAGDPPKHETKTQQFYASYWTPDNFGVLPESPPEECDWDYNWNDKGYDRWNGPPNTAPGAYF